MTSEEDTTQYLM